MKFGIVLFMALFALSANAEELSWQVALNGDHRSAQNRARDEYRHPMQTLQFFGLKFGMTIVEVSPGGGWYTEILAPLMKGNGRYYAAHYSLNAPGAYYRSSLGKYLQKMSEINELYEEVIITQLLPPSEMAIAPPESVDLIVTFRNVHNWIEEDTGVLTMSAVFAALKPGGVFGVVQHRAKPDADVASMKESGYVTERLVMDMADAAGFVFAGSSAVNDNPKDTADHPEGVWTLPPALRLEETDRQKYLAIGESDRMTLKFIKPGR